MYVDGVVDRAVKAGASSRPPVLRTATPLVVPLIRSSNFDCSQVRVPSAKTNQEKTRIGKITTNPCQRIKFMPQVQSFKRRIQVTTSYYRMSGRTGRCNSSL